MDIWKRVFINEDNFKYKDLNEDKDIVKLNDNNLSSTAIITGSFIIENTNNDIKILLFV